MSLEVDHIPALNAPDKQISRLQQPTAGDKVLQKLIVLVKSQWPQDKEKMDADLKLFWNVRHSLTDVDGLVFKEQIGSAEEAISLND